MEINNKRRNRRISLIVMLAMVLSVFFTGMTFTAYGAAKKKTSKKAKDKQVQADFDKFDQYSNCAEKDETVYVIADAEGDPDKVIVSEWLKNPEKKKILKDRSILEKIKNVEGDQSYIMNKDNMVLWQADGDDIHYQGITHEPLPVDLEVTYQLDGKTLSPDKLAGKSGKVTIRFDYKNNVYTTANINGRTEKIYVPFLMMTGVVLDNEHFSDVQVSNGKIVSDGSKNMVMGFAMPGLQENLGISKSTFDIPSFVEITADAKDFQLDTTLTMVSSDMFNDSDFADIKDDYELKDRLKQFSDAANQLMDGSSKLYDGCSLLADNSLKLKAGTAKLRAGAGQLADGSIRLQKEGTGKLKVGAAQLAAGTSEFEKKIPFLVEGTKKLNEGTQELKAGTEKLNGKMPELTKGTSELNKGAQELKAGTLEFDKKIDLLVLATKQLNEGAAKVNAGTKELNSNMPALTEGTGKIKGGAAQLKKGTDKLNQNAPALAEGASKLSGGLESLTANNNLLKGGSSGMVKAMLDTTRAEMLKELKPLGYTEESIPELTAENYQTVIDGIIGQLSSSDTEARVKAAVQKELEKQLADQQLNAKVKQIEIAVENKIKEDVGIAQAQIQANIQKRIDSKEVEKAVGEAVGNAKAANLEKTKQAIFAEVLKNNGVSSIEGLNELKKKAASGDAEAIGKLQQIEKDSAMATAVAGIVEKNAEGAVKIAAETAGNKTAEIINQETAKGMAGIKETIKSDVSQIVTLSAAGVQEDFVEKKTVQIMKQIQASGAELENAKEGIGKCIEFNMGIDSYTSGASALSEGAKRLNEGVKNLPEGAKALAAGADQLFAGIGTLDQKVKLMAEGVGKLDEGAGRLSGALNEMNGKMPALKSGTEQIRDGAEALADGTAKLDENSRKLAEAVEQLDKGAGKIADGTGEMEKKLPELTEGVKAINGGAQQLLGGIGLLDQKVGELKQGAQQLSAGAIELDNGTSKLVSGTAQLKDGSMQLSEGMKKFNEEGVQKITDMIDGEFGSAVARLKATADASRDYTEFAGKEKGTDGSVKFIYRTADITKTEKKEK